MADRPAVRTRPITREKLAQFLPSQELIKAFEALAQDVGTTLPDAVLSASEAAASAASSAASAALDAALASAQVAALQTVVVAQRMPVGSVLVTSVATDPGTLLGYGTWELFGSGRVLVGVDPSDSDFDTVQETGGSKTAAI